MRNKNTAVWQQDINSNEARHIRDKVSDRHR